MLMILVKYAIFHVSFSFGRMATRILMNCLSNSKTICIHCINIFEFIFYVRPVLVGPISHIGVCGVWCGLNHCLIQTLDGRVFGWRSNTAGQLTESEEVAVQNTPILCGRGMSVAAGDDYSILLDHSGSIQMLNINMQVINICLI